LKPSRVFYGWWIVAASFLTGLYTAGVIFYGFTTVFEPIAEDLGWSYTQISLASSIRGLEAGLLAPIVGLLADRWGPRRLVFIGAIFTSLGLLLLSRTQTLGVFYASFILIALGMSFGTMTVLMTAIANWFHHRVGLASGIAVSGFGFGGLLIPVIVRLIESYEWRGAITILALGVLLIILPLSLVFRHKPEQYGYLPDGQTEDPAVSTNNAGLSSTSGADFTTKQTLKSRAFWHMGLAFVCHTMLVSATITHVMPYLSSIGIARSRASVVAMAIPLTSICGRLGLGWLGDKVNRKLVLAAALAAMSLGIFCFGYTSVAGAWLLVVFIILFGVGYGGSIALRPSLVREYFGRSSFGTVFGLITGITMLGGIIGPPLAGWVYDNWGGYQGIWYIFAGFAGVAIVSVLTTPQESTGEGTVDII